MKLADYIADSYSIIAFACAGDVEENCNDGVRSIWQLRKSVCDNDTAIYKIHACINILLNECIEGGLKTESRIILKQINRFTPKTIETNIVIDIWRTYLSTMHNAYSEQFPNTKRDNADI